MTEATSRVITELVWTEAGSQVRVHDDGAAASVLVPLVGLRLNYRAGRDRPRRCLGHRTFTSAGSVHVDCSAAPEPGSRKCTRCSIIDAAFAANVHHAHTRQPAEADPAFEAHLRQPNVLYLAAFRDGSIKVGTSTAARRHQRLAEQGAWRARIVAETTDGVSVRVLEDRVTAELDVPQSVAARRKVDGMVTPALDERIDAVLDRAEAAVRELLAAGVDDRITGAQETWFHPAADRPVWQNVHPYPIDLAAGSHDLEVVDTLGRVIALRRPDGDDVFVADLQRLFGIDLELGDFASDELAVQDSLF